MRVKITRNGVHTSKGKAEAGLRLTVGKREGEQLVAKGLAEPVAPRAAPSEDVQEFEIDVSTE
jgi:hypothetical protein